MRQEIRGGYASCALQKLHPLPEDSAHILLCCFFSLLGPRLGCFLFGPLGTTCLYCLIWSNDWFSQIVWVFFLFLPALKRTNDQADACFLHIFIACNIWYDSDLFFLLIYFSYYFIFYYFILHDTLKLDQKWSWCISFLLSDNE